MLWILMCDFLLSLTPVWLLSPSSGARSTCWQCCRSSWLSSALRSTPVTSATTGATSGWASSAAWRESAWSQPVTGSGSTEASPPTSSRWGVEGVFTPLRCGVRKRLHVCAAVPATGPGHVPDRRGRLPLLRHQNPRALLPRWVLPSASMKRALKLCYPGVSFSRTPVQVQVFWPRPGLSSQVSWTTWAPATRCGTFWWWWCFTGGTRLPFISCTSGTADRARRGPAAATAAAKSSQSDH